MTVVLDSVSQVDWAVGWLREGKPIALPTETVYGLAALALDPAALARIFALKARPHFDPLIVHVAGWEQAESLASEMLPIHRTLAARFWPGPLTMVVPKRSKVPDLCSAGTQTVALRSPSHEVFRRVLKQLGAPLAAPSANRFGRISPTTAEHVVAGLGPYGLEAVVDGGPCRHGIESTVVQAVDATTLRVLRAGAISVEEIRAKLGIKVKVLDAKDDDGEGPVSPGLLKSHYAPERPLRFIRNFEDFAKIAAAIEPKRWALLRPVVGLAPDIEALPWKRTATLSERGSDTEAATRLFATLHELDAEPGLEGIVALSAPERGLGAAINDRLFKAAGSPNE